MTTHSPVRPLALVAAAAVLVAACGSPAATTAPTTAAATVAPPTVAPATQAPGSIGPGMSFGLPNEARDLEAILPSELGGMAVQKFSMTGDSFLGTGQGTEEMEAALEALGKQPSDLSVAFGGTTGAVIIAFRIKGVDANAIYQAVVQAQQAEDVATITDVTVAGKSAKQVVDAEATTTYLYLTGDVVVTVTGVGDTFDDALLNEIFSKLP